MFVCVYVCTCGKRGIDIGCPGLAVNGVASYGQNVSSINQIKIIKYKDTCIHTYIHTYTTICNIQSYLSIPGWKTLGKAM